MLRSIFCLFAFLGLFAAQSAFADDTPILNIGDALVSEFSGVRQPAPQKPPLTPTQILDRTFIDLDGTSAQVTPLAKPGFAWDARAWPAQITKTFQAKDIGQVFGVALDDAPAPNAYFTSTSAFGLQIVAPDPAHPGQFTRLKQGRKDAVWMAGQWGGADKTGGPGSIWKADGVTGQVTLFANVMLNNEANAGAGLGNIAYDAAHKQLFVSDLSTGMIHRFGLDGKELEIFDHGVTGRNAAKLAPVPYDATAALDITKKDFDVEAPDTWGFAADLRRVWGLTVHDGRLFYAVVGDSQIWSVGIDAETGAFLGDPQWELDVPRKPKPLPVSTMLFTAQGAMMLAQRGEVVSDYDYLNFADTGKSRLYQFWLKPKDAPPSPSSWIAEPEEYAVGFEGNQRSTNGGVALGYGYTTDGVVDGAACEGSVWTTGENLRHDEALKDKLMPGGALIIDGLQGMPIDLVEDKNVPPWTSYMVDINPANTDPNPTKPLPYGDIATTGWVGDLVILHSCGGRHASNGGAGGGGAVITGGGNGGGGGNPPPPVYDLAIAKTGVAVAKAAGTFTFNLAVTNLGDTIVNAAAIQVTDIVPAGMTFTNYTGGPNWNCIPLAPPIAAGGTLTCTYIGAGPIMSGAALSPINITATTPLGGTFKNCSAVGFAAASGLQDSDPSNNTSCAEVKISFDLAIVKTGAATPNAVAGSFNFALAVSNPGDAIVNAAAIVVTDVVPAGMTFTSYTGGPNWNCIPLAPPILAGGTLTCTYIGAGPILSAAALSPINITATAPLAGTFKNCSTVGFTAVSTLQDSDLSNNSWCATVSNPIDLGITKTGGPISSDKGGTTALEFDLAVTNAGLGFTGANNVTVTDIVPSGMTYSFLSMTPAGSWSCPTTPVTAGNSFICTYLGGGPVGPGASMGTIMISATPPPSPDETVTNCATVGVTTASGLQDSNASNDNACVTLNGDGLVPVKPRPPMPSCGFNTIFVVDISGSMGSHVPSEVPDITTALTNVAAVFNQGGSQTAEIYFATNANYIHHWPSAYSSLSYPAIPLGETNWEAALQMATTIPAPLPTVVIFITDGAPNRYLDSSGNVVYTNNTNLAANAAVPFVNQLYTAGIPIIGIGITGGTVQPATATNMADLLGPTAMTTPYGGLTAALTGVAHSLCPGLYLTKSFSQDYFNYDGLTAAPQVNVTLNLTNFNAGAPLSQVVVHDDLPLLPLPLTLASAPPPSFVPTPPTQTVAPPGLTLPGSGGEFVWTINSLPFGASPSATFPVTLPWPGPAPGACVTIQNYAQVQAAPAGSDGLATPGNMTNAVTGTNHEVDEAHDHLTICNTHIPPGYCVEAGLVVTKVYNGSAEACIPGSVCPFTVSVTSRCINANTTGPGINGFNGPVEFGEGVYSVPSPTTVAASGTLVVANGLTISSSISGPGSMAPAPPCATNSGWTPSSSTASACSSPNVTLPFGSTITFPVTINAPTSATYPANFLNCFIADGKSPTTTSYGAAFSNVQPLQTLGPIPEAWANCAPFVVDVTAPMIHHTCAPPTIPGPTPNSCVCPNGKAMVDGVCSNRPLPPVKVTCTDNTHYDAATGKCVDNRPVCTGNSHYDAGRNSCVNNKPVCPTGTVNVHGNCVPVPHCEPPMMPVPGTRKCFNPLGGGGPRNNSGNGQVPRGGGVLIFPKT